MLGKMFDFGRWCIIGLVAFEVIAIFSVGAIFTPMLADLVHEQETTLIETTTTVDDCVVIIGNNGSGKVC